jgi:predicted Zn-dependent protease
MRRNNVYYIILLLLLPAAGCVAPRYNRPVYRPTPAPKSVPSVQQGRQQADKPDNGLDNRSSVHSPQVPRPVNQAAVRFGKKADGLVRQGRLKQAAQTLEQGLRIAPKDALLWSKLARVRLKQGHNNQARSLATKSNSLARGSQGLIRQNNSIIAEADRAE